MTYLQKKKRAFMSIVNKVKGFVRTVTGIPPLTLPSCVDEESIINYTIFGNSVQDGTPTPDAPIEIESVGEKTVNLFDDYVYYDASLRYSPVISLTQAYTFKQGVTYTISFDTPPANKYVYFHFYSKTVEGIAAELLDGTRKSFTVTPTEDISTNRVISLYSAMVEGESTGLCSNCMIVEGNATEYEPYGYKIPVKVSGKNLFYSTSFSKTWKGVDITFDAESQVLTLNGTLETIPGTWGFKTINIIDTSIWTISIKEIGGKVTGDYGLFIGVNSAYTLPTYGRLQMNETIDTSRKTGSISDCNYIIFYNGSKANVVYDNYKIRIQVEEGAQTEYEPYVEPITTNIYLNEPLRKVDDYADYIDFENQKVTREIKEIVLDGTEEWLLQSINSYDIANFFTKKVGAIKQNLYISNRFEAQTTSIANTQSEGMYYANAGTFYIRVNSIRASKVSDFKTWLSNNNVNLYVKTETPTEETIDLSKLPTFKGTTVYSIETTTQPSNMSATYYSTSKGD